MRSQTTTTPAPLRNGTLVLRGFGIKVNTAYGWLRCEDGIGPERRKLAVARADGLKRLVVLGRTGYISFEAMHWLHGIGASLVVLDHLGEVTASFAPRGTDIPHLRRAQATARDSDVGLVITRALLAAKIAGQAATLSAIGDLDGAKELALCHDGLTGANKLDELRGIEAQAASRYWQAWQAVPVPFPRQDQRIRAGWRFFGPRASALTGQPRRASLPGQAIRNYLYGVLEGEARIACEAVGLDVGIALLHADQVARDSLLYDVMEPVRPEVDRWLFDWLNKRTLRWEEVRESASGQVLLTNSLRMELAETAPLWAQAIAPWAEYSARELAAKFGQNVPTPLTQARRSAGRSPQRKGEPPKKRVATVRGLNACRECGVVLDDSERAYCDDCYRERRHANIEVRGTETLARARVAGNDPAHGGEAALRRGETQRQHFAERVAWEAEHADGATLLARFKTDVQPALGAIPASRIARATGLSERYANMIRRGERQPHPMYVDRLQALFTP